MSPHRPRQGRQHFVACSIQPYAPIAHNDLNRSVGVNELDWQPFIRRNVSKGAVNGPKVRFKLLRQHDAGRVLGAMTL